MVDRQAFDLEKYQTQKDELQRQAMLRDPEKAYLISNEEFDKRLDELGWKPKDLMAIADVYKRQIIQRTADFDYMMRTRLP